ncbi:MAG TPA: isoprenylcysteine carboxylmethyltransferase family protein [Gemmatimonadaceae bacterium]|jgi:protein-S-isoprenylcysteine O-methyltransferase Ste14|nr:isoprenylcysteine carboxylmethyltransferase family protein [Gemmatimonadaceae bacterium]
MLRQIVGLAGYVALFGLLLYAGAGTLEWRAAWVLLATLFMVRGISVVLLWRTQRSLLDERSTLPLPQAGQPAADRILLPLSMASFAGIVFFSALDVWHLRLLSMPPFWLRVAGLAAFTLGWWVVYRALRTNAFAVTVVRCQHERAQHVIDTGPYAVVRHPMYAGLIPVMAGLALWLGSLAGALLAVVPVTFLAIRIVVEERMLNDRLPGYSEYRQRVRARLVPGIW